MPKQLINLIGILVSVAVLALGIFLVAMPLATQALGTYAQSQQVAQTNTLYQAQVDALTTAKQNKAQTDAAVAALRAQIPEMPQLDQVFDLVATASQSSSVSITSVTAGTPSPFVARTAATPVGDPNTTSAAPSPSPSATAPGAVGQAQQARDQANAQTGATDEASGAAGGTNPTTPTTSRTRTQIDFAITVTAKTMDQVTAFLDALRAGPRLLSNVTSVVAPSGNGIALSVTALTYVDGPAVAGGTK